MAIEWTARETFACALCWSGFARPPLGAYTPETYWADLPDLARNQYRAQANALLLLAVARGDAVALTGPSGMEERTKGAYRAALGLKQDHRLWQVLQAVYNVTRELRDEGVRMVDIGNGLPVPEK